MFLQSREPVATTAVLCPAVATAQTAATSGGPIDPAILDDLVVANHVLADQGVLDGLANLPLGERK